MRKTAAVIFILIMCLVFSACGAEPVLEQTAGQKTAPAVSPALAAQDTAEFAYSSEVYTDPATYTGKTYAGIFKVASGEKEIDGSPAYLANRLKFTGGTDDAYTALSFKEGSVPDLPAGGMVYVRGTIKGKKTVDIALNRKADVLVIEAGYIERDAANARVVSENKEYDFQEGSYKALSGSLSIDITRMFFTRNNMVVCVKTADSTLKDAKTFHFDVIAHQGGIFAWNFDSKFWMDPSSDANYDYMLFPALDYSKDLSLEFVAFDGAYTMLGKPFSINIRLSEEALKPSESATPTEAATPTESETPTEPIEPTETVSPTQTVKAS